MNAERQLPQPLVDALGRRATGWTLFFWVLVVLWFLHDRWNAVHWLSLSDTDDNMRLMQVRAWLHGQGWYDLRQYRLDPPRGFDIHWTRIVDLPIAGLIVALKPFVGEGWAERLACGIAPLVPLSVAMLALGTATRRLVSPIAWPVALVFVLMCGAALPMFMPERIDHHGWQLAALAVALAGLVDPARARGGLTTGLASAFSLSIGLEMLPFAAIAGAVIVARWISGRDEARRMIVYGAALGGGTALGYAGFASYANAVARCDALTPVWLSVMVEAGGLLVVLGWLNPASRAARLALAGVAGAVIVGAFAGAFPQCLGRPEQASDELRRNWLDNIREAKPIYAHPYKTVLAVVALPIAGLIGAVMASWRARGDARFAWGGALMLGAASAAMLVWQTRIGPAAQLLAVPGAVALVWIALPPVFNHRWMLARVFGAALVFMVASGGLVGLMLPYLPDARPSAQKQAVRRASATCPSYSALAPLNRLPPQTVFTFIDLGPRLITLTHHDAIAGPYHRNGAAILDVQHGFGGSAEQFRAIARAHGATLLLICPNMAEATIYRARNPGGFYEQIVHGHVPAWLEPVPLPARSPFRLWRIH